MPVGAGEAVAADRAATTGVGEGRALSGGSGAGDRDGGATGAGTGALEPPQASAMIATNTLRAISPIKAWTDISRQSRMGAARESINGVVVSRSGADLSTVRPRAVIRGPRSPPQRGKSMRALSPSQSERLH